MSSSNTTRNVDYIQHDAPINSGNSGGGLFDYMGNLIGINTLKYRGNVLSSSSYEGLGFAIPIDTAYPLAQQLIQYGKVIRPQLGITVADQTGPDEAMNDYPPASVRVNTINAGSPAEKAGMQQNDFIIALNGERITSRRELTTLLDKFQPGDTVTVTVVRYQNVTEARNNDYGNYYGYGNFPFGFGFGNYGYGNYGPNGYGSNGYGSNGYTYTYGDGILQVSGGYTTIDLQVTLEAQK